MKKEYRKVLAEYLHLHMIRVPKMFDPITEKSKEFNIYLDKKGLRTYDENTVKITALRLLLRIGSTPKANIPNAFMKKNVSIEFFPRTRVNIASSDSPVVMYDETRSPGLAYETTDVYFPLEKSIFLRYWGFGDELRLVKHKDISVVEDLNYILSRTAYKEIYSSDKSTLEKIADRMNIKVEVKMPGNL